MKTGKLLILTVAALALCVTAVVVYNGQNRGSLGGDANGATGLKRGAVLMSALAEGVEEVTRIECVDDAGSSVTLERGQAGAWRVASSGGYPAASEKLAGCLRDLLKVTVADSLSANPEKYDAFGLTDENPSGGAARFFDKDGHPVSALWLGNERGGGAETMGQGARGQYVRVGNDPRVYLIREGFSALRPALANWINTEIVAVPRAEVVSVSIDHGSTASIKVAWPESKPVLDGLDKASEQIMQWELDSTRSALDRLSLEDVARADSEAAKSLKWPVVYTAWTGDGIRYEVRLSDGMAHYAALKAVSEAPEIPAPDDDKATTETRALAQSAEARAKKAAALNERVSPWVYKISDYDYRKLSRRRDEVVEAKKNDAKAADERPSIKEGAEFLDEN